MSGNDARAVVVAIMGSTGSGKTTTLRGMLAKPKRKRTLIWSPKEAKDRYADLYPGSMVVNTTGAALQAVKAAGKGPLHVVFAPRLVRKIDETHFDVFCRIAMAAGNLTVVVDELHTVTRPSWAPDGWSQLVMMGRAYGCEVFGLSQRPASMDKDFLGNCSMVHTGRLALPDDARVVAKAIGVSQAEVSGLSGFSWIRRDMDTGQVVRS